MKSLPVELVLDMINEEETEEAKELADMQKKLATAYRLEIFAEQLRKEQSQRK